MYSAAAFSQLSQVAGAVLLVVPAPFERDLSPRGCTTAPISHDGEGDDRDHAEDDRSGDEDESQGHWCSVRPLVR